MIEVINETAHNPRTQVVRVFDLEDFERMDSDRWCLANASTAALKDFSASKASDLSSISYAIFVTPKPG